MSIFRMQIPCSFGNCTNVDLEQCDECKQPVCSSHRRQRDPRYGGGFLCQRCMAERQSSTSHFPPEVEALLGQAAQVNPSLAQWEYCRVKQQGSTAVIFLLQGSKPHKLIVGLGLPYGTDPDGLKDYVVTRLGADGWEMVSHHYVAVEQAEQWYFKRRRQQANFRAVGPK